MATPLNIVVVEDHDDLRVVTCALLQEEGHTVQGVASAEEILDSGRDCHVDIFILDVNLPGEDGFSLARRLRTVQPGVGIIMTTARDERSDKILGYDSGADIYMPKPVDPEELTWAVRSLARRLQLTTVPFTANLNPVAILNTQRRRLTSNSHETLLTASEAAALATLARAPNHFVAYWQLLELLDLQKDEKGKSSLEVRMVRLREKIMSLGYPRTCIRSVRGSGYELGIELEIR